MNENRVDAFVGNDRRATRIEAGSSPAVLTDSEEVFEVVGDLFGSGVFEHEDGEIAPASASFGTGEIPQKIFELIEGIDVVGSDRNLILTGNDQNRGGFGGCIRIGGRSLGLRSCSIGGGLWFLPLF